MKCQDLFSLKNKKNKVKKNYRLLKLCVIGSLLVLKCSYVWCWEEYYYSGLIIKYIFLLIGSNIVLVQNNKGLAINPWIIKLEFYLFFLLLLLLLFWTKGCNNYYSNHEMIKVNIFTFRPNTGIVINSFIFQVMPYHTPLTGWTLQAETWPSIWPEYFTSEATTSAIQVISHKKILKVAFRNKEHTKEQKLETRFFWVCVCVCVCVFFFFFFFFFLFCFGCFCFFFVFLFFFCLFIFSYTVC